MLRRLKSRKLGRRKGNRRLKPETLERRMLLAGDTLHFDTTLEILDLSGGPFAMPLAHDPGNVLGDSIDGYGFVDATVTVTLSSQRAVNPGQGTEGEAWASLARQEFFGGVPAAIQNNAVEDPIDPNELDGEEFFVDSFFDVFFDITVTDVDSRPGRDFAGQTDGATIVIQDQGPGRLQSQYFAIFDKDAPNYGLVPPPPEASRPYVGHFDIAIELPGDVNGNGITPDYLKFELASHLAGAATFITLPDGTVIDEFDSTATILGAVSDNLADPPFTIGSVIDPLGCDPGGSFPGFPDPCTPVPGTGLSGPTTATSTLTTPVIGKDPGFSYVDANNDKLFNPADGDVALDAGQLDDGVFDTDSVLDGAGLVINGPAISTLNINYSADLDLTVNTDLTARQRRGTLLLTSRFDDVLFDDPTVTTSGNLIINAPAGDVLSTDDALRAIGPSSKVDIDAGGLIYLGGTAVEGGRDIEMDAGSRILMTLSPTSGAPTTLTATYSSIGKIDLNAPAVDLRDVDVNARKDIVIEGDDVTAFGTTFTANGNSLAAIDVHGLVSVDISGSVLTARKSVVVEAYAPAASGLTADGSTVQAVGAGATSVNLISHSDIAINGATVSASRLVNIDAGGAVGANGASLTATTTGDASVVVEAVDDIMAHGSTISGRLLTELESSGGSVLADGASIEAISPSSGEVDVDAFDDVFLRGTDVHAGRTIDIDALVGDIHANGAHILACNSPGSVVTLFGGGDVVLVGAMIRAAVLIDIVSGGTTNTVDAQGSSIGIWRPGTGDISIAGDTIDVNGATIRAPGDVDLLASSTLLGTPIGGTLGTLACP